MFVCKMLVKPEPNRHTDQATTRPPPTPHKRHRHSTCNDIEPFSVHNLFNLLPFIRFPTQLYEHECKWYGKRRCRAFGGVLERHFVAWDIPRRYRPDGQSILQKARNLCANVQTASEGVLCFVWPPKRKCQRECLWVSLCFGCVIFVDVSCCKVSVYHLITVIVVDVYSRRAKQNEENHLTVVTSCLCFGSAT